MPPKLRPVSGEETIRVLKRLGFVPVRQRGSHVVLKKQIPLQVVLDLLTWSQGVLCETSCTANT
jgi:predicted RNA binding protein YcfA (HicA-like mRNA interferase family)